MKNQLKLLINFLTKYRRYSMPLKHHSLSYIFQRAMNGVIDLTEDERYLLEQFKIIEPLFGGRQNMGGFIGEEVVFKVQSCSLINDDRLIAGIQQAYKDGANISNIIDVVESHGLYYILMSRVHGEVVNCYAASHDEEYAHLKFLKASNKQIMRLIRDLAILNQNNVLWEYIGDNMMYDPELGFALYDFERLKSEPNDLNNFINLKKEQLIKAINIDRANILPNDVEKFFTKMSKLYSKSKDCTIGELNAELSST